MKRTTFSHAVRWVLAAQVLVSLSVVTCAADAQYNLMPQGQSNEPTLLATSESPVQAVGPNTASGMPVHVVAPNQTAGGSIATSAESTVQTIVPTGMHPQAVGAESTVQTIVPTGMHPQAVGTGHSAYPVAVPVTQAGLSSSTANPIVYVYPSPPPRPTTQTQSNAAASTYPHPATVRAQQPVVYRYPPQPQPQPQVYAAQTGEQQFVFVESSQPGLYRRVPVAQFAHATAQVAPQNYPISPAGQSSPVAVPDGFPAPMVSVAPVAPKQSVERIRSDEKASPTPERSTRTSETQATVQATPESSKDSERSRLPILTNPMLTQRGAIQAREIAIEQAKKQAAARRSARARASTYALATAGARTAQHVVSTMPPVSVASPLLSQSMPAAPNPARGSHTTYPTSYQPVPRQFPNYRVDGVRVPVAPPQQVLMQLPNGQWMVQTLVPQANVGPTVGGLIPQPVRPLSPVSGPAVVYPGQIPSVGAPGPSVNPFPREPVTQLTPPVASVIAPEAATPLATLAQVASKAVVGQLVAPPRPRVRQRRLTGSLTQSEDQTSSQPLHSIDRSQIQLSTTGDLESVLNTRAPFTPSSGATTNPGQGLATADVRGLGAEYSAVLINGRPMVSANGQGMVNLDSIPTPLIHRIDAVTGGTTVAYGVGGLAGAVNVVTDDRFQGAQFDLSHQTAFDGEAGTSTVSATLGRAFANNKANVAITVGASERQGVFMSDREASEFPQFDNTNAQGDLVLINGGNSAVPGTSIFAGALGDFAPDSFGATFDQNGSIRPFAPITADGGVGDFYNYHEASYLLLPQRRQQGMAVASLAVTEQHELYGTVLATSNETVNQFAPNALFRRDSTFTLDDSPYLPAPTLQILSDAFGDGIDSDGDGIDDTGTAFIRRRMTEFGDRRNVFESTTQFAEGGLRGRFGRLDYDLYASRGRVSETVTRGRAVNAERLAQGLVLNLDTNLDGTTCLDTSSNGGPGPCQPVNIFGAGNISDAAVDWLSIFIDEAATSSLSTYGASLSSELNLLPAGATRITLGAERRETRFERMLNSSEPITPRQTFLNNLQSAVTGRAIIDDVYGEVSFPLAANLPLLKQLNAEAGFRLSNHSTAGQFASYRASALWSPIDRLSVRAAYSQTAQAPTLLTLFADTLNTMQPAVDPCSAAAGPLSPETAAQCAALGVPDELIGSVFLNLPSGQLVSRSGGNADLDATSATSTSLGLLLDTPIFDAAHLRFSADYFDIRSSSAAGVVQGTGESILARCFDGSFALNSELSPYCNYVQRRSDGSLDFVDLTPRNNARFSTTGVDISASFRAALERGVFSLDYSGTQLHSTSFTEFTGDEPRQCSGRFGRLCGEPRPTYRHRLSANYEMDNVSAGLIWRHVGRTTDDDDSSDYAVESINALNYVDVQFSFPVTEFAELAVGVNNLANTLPPVLGGNQSTANTYPQTYDAIGRSVFLRLSSSSDTVRR